MISIIKRCFSRNPERTLSWWQIILWWEIRRVPINVFMAAFGVLVYLSVMAVRSPSQYSMAERNSVALSLACTLLLSLNILYTVVWMVETMVWRVFKLWYLGAPDKTPPWYKSILWWEVRRIPFNIAAILLGTAGYLLFIFILSPDEFSSLSPDFLFSRVTALLVLLVNILYTVGWLLEVLLRLISKDRSPHLGPALLTLWLVLTALLAFFPVGGLFLLSIHHVLFDDCFGPYCF
jgi:hypothetical protein